MSASASPMVIYLRIAEEPAVRIIIDFHPFCGALVYRSNCQNLGVRQSALPKIARRT